MKRVLLTAFVMGSIAAMLTTATAGAETAPIQYLVIHGSNQLVTPAVAFPSATVKLEVRPSYAPAKSKLENLRNAFGGTIPRLVVTSDRNNWVIVSQEKDILVIGHQQPLRRMIAPQSYVLVTCEDGTAIVLNSTFVPAVVTQRDQLTVSPELPAWLPRDLFKSRVDVVRKETVYSPNQKYTYATGESLEVVGITYRKFVFRIQP